MPETVRPTSPSARLMRFVTSAHVFLYRLTRGIIGGRMGRASVLLMTTGRRSGRQRTTPLFYVADGDHFLVVASNGGRGSLPNWWSNMRETGQAQIEIGSRRLQVRGKQATLDERLELWRRVVEAYAGYEQYQQKTDYPIPVVILEPV